MVSGQGKDEQGQSGAGQAPKVGGWYVLVVLAAIGAYFLNRKGTTVYIEVDDELSAFAVFYIVAQAVERLVEPLLGVVKAPDANKEKLAVAESRVAVDAASAGDKETAAKEEVSARQELDVVQGQRAVVAWSLASTAALIVCGLLGLGLIESVADVKGAGEWWHGLDVVVTGLAVGAGTKPLHDLITRVENSKKKSDTAVPAAS